MLNKDEILFSEYSDESVDVEFGRGITPEYEDFVVRSFLSKGMREAPTLQKSAYTKTRTFTANGDIPVYDRTITSQKLWNSVVKQNSKALDLADKLIKSLEDATKNDQPNQLSNRTPVNSSSGWSQDQATGAFHHKIHGVISINKTPNGFSVRHHGSGMSPDLGTYKTPQEAGAKIREHMSTLGSMKPAKMAPTVKSEIEKSNYGPKGMSQYNPVDNIKRKANNTGDTAGQGPNTNVKSYSSKPGQLSAKAQAALEAARMKEKNKQQPVKVYSKEEIEEMNRQRAMQKSAPEWTEDEMANKLSSIIPFGQKANLQPSNEEFEQGMLNAGIAVTQQQLDEMNKGWGGAIADFFAEASKPISSRFSSEEEELAYWNSIRVVGKPDNGPGY